MKNKVAPPFKTAECEILYGKGLSYTASLLNLGVQFNIIQKSGAWFSYNDMRIGQGRDNARQYLEDNPEIAQEVKEKIFQVLNEQLGKPKTAENA